MRNYVILLAFACVITIFPGRAQVEEKATIITYYNMTKADDEKIRLVEGKWKIFVRGEPAEAALIDIENGYIEFIDGGTGGGSTKVTVALFLAKNREPMLAEFHEYYGTGTCPDAGFLIRTCKLRQGRMAEVKDVLPAIPLDLFFKSGYDLNKIAPYMDLRRVFNKNIGYRLPRFGTMTEVFIYAGDITCSLESFGGDMAVKEREARREFLKNLLKEPVKLKWNMETGAFDPPGQG